MKNEMSDNKLKIKAAIDGFYSSSASKNPIHKPLKKIKFSCNNCRK